MAMKTYGAFKRFLLFAGDNYYPSAAFGDFKESFDTLKEAWEAAHDSYLRGVHPTGRCDWAIVVDLETGLDEGV